MGWRAEPSGIGRRCAASSGPIKTGVSACQDLLTVGSDDRWEPFSEGRQASMAFVVRRMTIIPLAGRR